MAGWGIAVTMGVCVVPLNQPVRLVADVQICQIVLVRVSHVRGMNGRLRKRNV